MSAPLNSVLLDGTVWARCVDHAGHDIAFVLDTGTLHIHVELKPWCCDVRKGDSVRVVGSLVKTDLVGFTVQPIAVDNRRLRESSAEGYREIASGVYEYDDAPGSIGV
jgi:hypothetical protein